MTDNTNPTPELPRQIWGLRLGDGFLFSKVAFDDRVEAYSECVDATPVLLHDQDAIDELVAAAEVSLDRLDYLQNLWGKEAITNRTAETMRAAIARVKGGA